jgi:hypothetical protein
MQYEKSKISWLFLGVPPPATGVVAPSGFGGNVGLAGSGASGVRCAPCYALPPASAPASPLTQQPFSKKINVF